MRVKGWLLDVRLRNDEAFLWVKKDEERHEYRGRYVPDLFVLPNKVSFEEFMELFDEHPYISDMEKVTRYVSIGDIVKSSVIRVKVDSVEQFRTVQGLVRKYGEVFDCDLSHTQRFIADYGLIPLAEVELNLDAAGKISSISSIPLDLRVRPPPFKVLCFELNSEEDRLTITTLDEGMRKEYCFHGGESEALISFLEFIEDTDPDLISSLESDMKKLLKLCLKHNKPPLGVYRRNRFHLEKGRVFISLHIYRRTSLAGIVERIMYTREVPRVGSEYAAGRAIESRQCYEARRLGYLLPQRGFYQPVMSLEELLRERDHGGLIFAPTIGLHENVAALDFESMFPHLILKENISYENVRTQRESEGFLLEFTKDTLQRRLYFKHHRRQLLDQPDMWFWCETRQQALKEILFCTYGYSGCWANKFGNMDTFMEINKAARENLVTAMNIARASGYNTLYGNSDSLFLSKEGAGRKDYDNLALAIKEQIDLPITVENHFKFLVLLPQKSSEDFGAINRYYGLRYDGKLVCRGIELRRRNTPKFIADAQTEAIRVLLSRDTKKKVLKEGIEAVNKFISKSSSKLKQGLVPIEELEAKTILRRKLSRYKSKSPHVAAAEAMDINGSEVERGSVIGYVYVDSSQRNPFRRVSPAGYQSNYDAKKYVQLLKEAKRSILLPFLKDEERSLEKESLDRFF